MAAITRIRQYFWLLVVMMVLGLVGFIFMDSSGQPSNGPNTVGVVNGKEIGWTEFQKAENALYPNSTGNYLAQRSSIWNYFMEEAIVSAEAEKLGLGVSNKELTILQFGENGKFHSEVIKTRNTDQQTRRLNQAELDTIKMILLNPDRNLPPDYNRFWTFQQKEIVKSRLQNKMAALVGKAAFTPTWMAEVVGENQNKKANVAYVKVPFGQIADDQVTLVDADYLNYMQDRKATYYRDEPSRKLAYVVFDIKPSAKDSADIVKTMNLKKQAFLSSTNDSSFLVKERAPWDEAYVLEAALPRVISNDLMTLPVGSVVGPYLNNGNYAITKIIDRQAVPDSVRSRHILIKAQDQASYFAAMQQIDSLKTLVETGAASFSDLAKKFGQDATQTKGGDLGYVAANTMVKPFNDLIFFKAKKGEIKTVATQFGVHLVEVTGKKYTNNLTGVQMGTISKQIIPSVATQNAIVNNANQFMRNNQSPEAMKAAAEADPNLTYVESKLVKQNDFFVDQLGSNQTSRKFVKWAFDKNTNTGSVNPNVFLYRAPSGIFDDKAVVGGLKAKVKAGIPPVEVMKEELKPLVMNLKKGEMLTKAIGTSDLNSIAAKYNTKVDTANNVAFSSGFIPGIGNEPTVVGTIFKTAQNATSTPVVGNGGVFVVSPLNMVKSNIPANVDMVRTQQDRTFVSQAKNFLIQSLKKKAKVEDNRSIFF